MSSSTPDRSKVQPAPPGIMVIFGAGGDLARRKLFPALYHLMTDGLLAENFRIIVVDRRDREAKDYRAYTDENARPHVSKGMNEVCDAELLADSGEATPRMLPCPKGTSPGLSLVFFSMV